MNLSGAPQACASFLVKWQTAFEDEGIDVEDTTWEDLMGNPKYGIAALVAGVSGGRVPGTAGEIIAAVGSIFARRQYKEVLDLNEANLLLGLFQKMLVPIPSSVPISCASLSLIAITPAEQLPAALENMSRSDSESDDDNEDEDSDAEPSTAPKISLPIPGGGGLPPSIYTPSAAVNPFSVPTGQQLLPWSAPFPSVGTAMPGLPVPQPAFPTAQQFPGAQFPSATTALPVPGQPPEGAKDLSYAAVAIRGLRGGNQSKLMLLKIPYADDPKDFITVEIFMTAGAAPKVITVMKFADEDKDVGDNPQKRVIYAQNAKTMNSKQLSQVSGMSDGVSESGVCAQVLELYTAAPMVKDADSGQELPFPIPLSECKPESGKVKSINQIASGTYLPPIQPTQTSGGLTAISVGGAPAGQQAEIEGVQDEPIPPGAIRVQAFAFAENAHFQPIINTYQLPGPRLMAIGGGWNWFELPGGKIGRAKTKFAPHGYKFDTRPGANQQKIYNAIRLLAHQRFGPGFASVGTGSGSAATGIPFAAPRPMTIVGQPLPAPSGNLNVMMGQMQFPQPTSGGQMTVPGAAQTFQFPQAQPQNLVMPAPGTQGKVPTYAPPGGGMLTLADLLRQQQPTQPQTGQLQPGQSLLQASAQQPSQMVFPQTQMGMFPAPQQTMGQQMPLQQTQVPLAQPAQTMGMFPAPQQTQVPLAQPAQSMGMFPAPQQTMGQQMPPQQIMGQQMPPQQTQVPLAQPAQTMGTLQTVAVQPIPMAQPGLQQLDPIGGAQANPANPGIAAIDVNQPYISNVNVPAVQPAAYIPLPVPPGQ